MPHPGPRDLDRDGHGLWYPDAARSAIEPYRYVIEASLDNKAYQPVVDMTANAKANNVEFAEFAPVRCRYVRLTVTGKPKGGPMAVLEFTVFGKPVEPAPRPGS